MWVESLGWWVMKAVVGVKVKMVLMVGWVERIGLMG